MAKSVSSFLLPQLDGSSFAALQVFFALVFVVAVVAIPLLLRKHARAGQWERRLAELDGADVQALAHATPEELSDAVATAPERWAGMLPGLLLMLGLLGTFIGIGLALSEVAGLSGANAARGLAPVMDALGANFKISAWGILAFLFLRIWTIAFPHEQARLAWSAKLVGARAAQAAERLAQQEAEQRRQLVDAVNGLVAAQQAEAQRAHVRHAELLEALSRPADTRA
ncbi:hypothetical protein Herbaro_19115 [Herbaspirillum sp. WKF16]|jgi:hypothetical protein|uniref:hypothetical protein n=1 Tax=Herbaspirillum sp. WKF16 TaxID=3028312 RepID=UPI0023A97CA9|nr:hypothetical protein [Herbaspirillum sp. WKF16]WDZ95568.1 hypothetical protein Herbaro_19115 [Herbaspirillum sp. WKF16]